MLQQGQGNANSALSEDDLKKLEEEVYQVGMFSDDEDSRCAICLSDYEPGDIIRRLPCEGRHHFHKDCVDDWLKLNASCPNCRFRIRSGDDDGDGDDNADDSSKSNDDDDGSSNQSASDLVEVRVLDTPV